MGSSNILLNHQISTEIISLIESSKEHCFLVTPYFKPWQLLNRALEKAASNKKKIVFIFRDGDVKQSVYQDLNKNGFDIHLIEKLHTKLYLNESTAILTSMNLYDSSKEFNYEVGYKFQNNNDVKNFKEAVIDKDILGTKPKLFLPGRYAEYISENLNKQSKIISKKTETVPGYCLRCRAEIPFDFNKPYCLECYKIWSRNNFPTKENYCHSCGARFRTSFDKPACNKCS